MGRQSVPADSPDPFRLDDYAPVDHLLRQLDAVLPLDHVRTVLAKYYSYTGRPSSDPELLLRMLLLGYAYGIRSERRLCREIHLNLVMSENSKAFLGSSRNVGNVPVTWLLHFTEVVDFIQR